MTDEGEDENEVATKKRKVSKATPKKDLAIITPITYLCVELIYLEGR